MSLLLHQYGVRRGKIEKGEKGEENKGEVEAILYEALSDVPSVSPDYSQANRNPKRKRGWPTELASLTLRVTMAHPAGEVLRS
jgi:hypothetical protein